MDWYSCKKSRLVKEISDDNTKHDSFIIIAEQKIKAATILPENDHALAIITLLYDVLRTLLEVLAIQKGYKIYNHECYTSFIKEVLGKSSEGDKFDELRKIRNGINYYGRSLSKEEGKYVIKELKTLIQTIKALLVIY